MKRVVVVGSGGSGKSTFSRALGSITGLPVIHLDTLFWKPNWTPTPKEEWREVVRHELARDKWIIDGNFGSTREMRMRAADTIIVLDLPRWLCVYRILKRMVKYRNEKRPDMAEGCFEKFDWEFVMWVWNYKKTSRIRLLDELESERQKNIIFLKSRGDVADFLKRMRLENR